MGGWECSIIFETRIRGCDRNSPRRLPHGRRRRRRGNAAARPETSSSTSSSRSPPRVRGLLFAVISYATRSGPLGRRRRLCRRRRRRNIPGRRPAEIGALGQRQTGGVKSAYRPSPPFFPLRLKSRRSTGVSSGARSADRSGGGTGPAADDDTDTPVRRARVTMTSAPASLSFSSFGPPPPPP